MMDRTNIIARLMALKEQWERYQALKLLSEISEADKRIASLRPIEHAALLSSDGPNLSACAIPDAIVPEIVGIVIREYERQIMNATGLLKGMGFRQTEGQT